MKISSGSSRKKKVSPRFLPKILGNLGAAQIAISYGLRGPSFTVSTACSSGGDAICTAAMLLASGDADAMLVVSGESAHCPIIMSTLAQAKALSRNPDPKSACRPFDADRDGFVMGEGGGASISTVEGGTSLSLYPNPASETLTITAGEGEITSVAIYSTSGSVMCSSKVQGNSFSCNVSSYTPGIYFAKVTANGKTEVLKFVVK